MAYNAIKDYFKFGKKELIHIIIIAFVMAFILSFKLWGETTFELNTGLINLVKYVLISLMIVMVYVACQKLYGLAMGINVEYFISKWVMVVSVVTTFITNGSFWLLMLGESKLSHIASHRIGHHRYELENKEHSIIILAGNIGLIFLAFVFKLFSYIPSINEDFVFRVMLAILAFNFFSLLPIPGTNGMIVLFTSRIMYVLSFSLILLISFFLIYFGIWYTIILSILCSILVLFGYLKFVEKELR